MPDVSIITSTFKRPKLLANLIQSVSLQEYGGHIEHIIVTDGHDPQSEAVCELMGMLRVHQCEPERVWGARPKDFGLSLARGRYCVFWDDDNIYEPWALDALMEAADGHDVGVVKATNTTGRFSTPYHMPVDGWREDGTDYLCVCVRTELAQRFRFEIPGAVKAKRELGPRLKSNPKSKEARKFVKRFKPYDRIWTRQVFAAAESINVSDRMIGIHL